MLRNGIILAAIAVYVITLLLVVRPNGTPLRAEPQPNPTAVPTTGFSTDGLPYRSVTMQIQRVDWIDKYRQSIDEIAAVGADTVLLVVDPRQENGKSCEIYLDVRKTPTFEQLGALIDHAKGKGMRVIVMPIVLLDKPQGNEWRGTITPQESDSDIEPGGWKGWFNSYRDMIAMYAETSENHHADMLVVGSELISSEPYIEEWTRTIAAVRKIFHGKLTYSANWDHYASIKFWDQLDMIAMNSYWKLGEDHNVGLDQIKERWKKIKTDLQAFQEGIRKPLMFLEAGWCSMQNAADEPWDYTKTNIPADPELQQRLYEGFFETWYGDRGLGGFSIWEWPPIEGGPSDRGYTPKNKPAERVLREWLGKHPWIVMK